MKKNVTATQTLYDNAISIALQQARFAKMKGKDKSTLYCISINNNLGSTYVLTNDQTAYELASKTERNFYTSRNLCKKDFDRKSYTATRLENSISSNEYSDTFANAVLLTSPLETETGDPTQRIFTLIAGDNLEDVTDFIQDQIPAIADYDKTNRNSYSSTNMHFGILADAVVDGVVAKTPDFYSTLGDRFSSVDTNLRYLGFAIMHDMTEAHEKNVASGNVTPETESTM